MKETWFEERNGLIRIRVRAQPRASRTEVAGEHGDALKIRVAAPPVDGEANEALVRFLAKKLGLPASAVRLVAGETGRQKTFEVSGLTADELRRALLG